VLSSYFIENAMANYQVKYFLTNLFWPNRRIVKPILRVSWHSCRRNI